MIQEKENAKEEINYDNGKKMKAFMPLEQELVSLNKPSESNPAGLRFIIRTWLSESSTHGIKNVYEADDWFLRIIWIICFLASFVYCTYLVIVTLIDYLSYPYLTSVEVIDEMPTPFPTIMLCNINPFRTDDSQVQSVMANWVNAVPFTTASAYLLSTTNSVRANLYDSSDTLKKSYGNQLKDMLLSCTFGSADCTSNDFTWFYDFNYVNCYKFNSNGTYSSGKIGDSYGLTMELYVGNSSSQEYYTGSRGIRYIVFNSTIDDPFINDQGLDAMPGEVTNVEISKVFFSRLPSPYTDCLDDLTSSNSNPTDLMTIMFDTLNQTQYNQLYCLNLCMQSALNKNCSCKEPSLPVINGSYPGCTSPTQYNCFKTLKDNFVADPIYYCGSSCPRECESYSYSLRTSSSQYLTNWYWSQMQNSFKTSINNQLYTKLSTYTLDQARAGILKLKFYMGSIGYTQISESPSYTADSLLGSIGGQLGLFVGMSILSFVEFFELGYLVTLYLIKWFVRVRKLKKNKVHESIKTQES